MGKRYSNSHDPLTLEQRIANGLVRLVVRCGEVCVLDRGDVELVRHSTREVLRRLGVLRGARFPVAAIVPLGGGRELRLADAGLRRWVGVEERVAIFLLLEGTPAWENRERTDPRTFLVPGVIRSDQVEFGAALSE